MSRSRLTFILCMLASAAVHAALLIGLQRWAAAHQPPLIAQEKVVRWLPPPIQRRPPQADLGEAKGTGEALNSSKQDDVQTALKSTEDQSALTRDPTGNGPGATASPPPTPPPAPQSPTALDAPVFAPPPAAPTFFPKSDAPTLHKVTPPAKPTPDQKPTPTQDPHPPSPQQQPAPNPPQPQQNPTPPQQQPPQPQQQQQATAGGKPMEHSDRDSDLFAKQASMEYRAGQVVARNGRVVKFSRPHENLAAVMDTVQIEFPAELKMQVQIDSTGHVRNVTILHSTGSGSIDRVFELATYSSWFEPAKDAQGVPLGDDIEFSIILN